MPLRSLGRDPRARGCDAGQKPQARGCEHGKEQFVLCLDVLLNPAGPAVGKSKCGCNQRVESREQLPEAPSSSRGGGSVEHVRGRQNRRLFWTSFLTDEIHSWVEPRAFQPSKRRLSHSSEPWQPGEVLIGWKRGDIPSASQKG